MPKRAVAKVKSDHPFESVNSMLDKFYSLKDFKSSKTTWAVILIIGILILGLYKKSLFVAALVNGSPITNLELQMKLNEQFRTQTLNELVNEKILLDEAKKSNNIPSEQEVDKKVSELETQVGGKDALNTLLSQQGQTLSGLRDQVKLQLVISKLYDKEATVSADEVAKFIEQNGSTLQSTDSAKQKEEAANLLKQQKLTQIFNQKFQDLRAKAKIQIF